MHSVCITHPQNFEFSVAKDSSQGKWHFNGKELAHWTTGELESAGVRTLVIDLGQARSFNSIRIAKAEGAEALYPNQFSIEMSDNGALWEGIIHEIDFKESRQGEGVWHFSLVRARFVRLVVQAGQKNRAGKHEAAIGALHIGIAGVQKIDVSSQLDRLWVKENLFDRRPDYGWSSSLGPRGKEEFFQIDLGSVSLVHELRLLTKDDLEPHFPENFTILASEDDITWHTILEESHFMAQKANWYRWRFSPMNIRYLKFISKLGSEMEGNRYVTQVVEFEMFALPEIVERAGTGDRKTETVIPYSSVLRSGLVRLARDGEINAGVAVQGSDRRLRDATSDSKGIVELATSGEDRSGVVVQGDDKRLKRATVESYGIVRLCPDGEYKKGQVVLGDDERLKPADEAKMGIVQLAKNGEARSAAVVQGNDRRLKDATESAKGITQLAPDGDTSPNKVIQGNDRRLRAATTEQPGILRFARDGEDEALAAVQGNDNRLKAATTARKGIVEWAEEGESSPHKAVQGSDPRLKPSSVDNMGLVRLSPKGEQRPNAVVQADDPRLNDAREPKPHSHDYASREHDYTAHTGRLIIEEQLDAKDRGVVKPGKNTGAVYFENSGNAAALTTSGSDHGIRTFGQRLGLYAHGKKNAIIAASLDGPAGIFSSQKDYAIFIQKKDHIEEKTFSSGKAIHAEGDSLFQGTTTFSHKKAGSHYIATWFAPERRDAIAVGEPVIISGGEADGSKPLCGKPRRECDLRFAGILVKDAPVILGDAEDDALLVAVYGVVPAAIDARNQPVNIGDPLVIIRPGYLGKFQEGKHKAAGICAKAMGRLERGEGSIPVLLR